MANRRKINSLTTITASLIGSLIVSACTTPFNSGVAPLDIPENYHESSKTSGKSANTLDDAQLATWWEQFNDPVLSDLIAQALERNSDLQIAMTRVDQARATERGALSALFPTIGYGAQIRRYRGGDTNSVILEQTGIDEVAVNYWQSGLQAVWEIDLFGAGRARLASSKNQAYATAADVQAVRLTLASTVASLYMSYRGAQQQQILLQKGLKEANEFLDIAKRSYKAGMILSTDINVAEAGVADVEAKLQQADATVAQLRLNLENISMLAPGSLESKLIAQAKLPSIPLTIAKGQPIDLLMRRPDLIAAQARFQAALSQSDAARLDYLPKLSLAGLFGQSGFTVTGGMPSGDVMWMGGLGLVLPLFDFGARKAQVEMSDARSREALLNYNKSVMNALFDVENALARLNRDEKQHNALQKQVNEREAILKKTNIQYKVGEVGRLDMALARVSLLDSQSSLLAQEVSQLQTQIALFRALGGGWDKPE